MAIAEKNLAGMRNALATMFNPSSPPQTAKEASDWLQTFRNDNEQRRRRIKRDVPSEGGCWNILISLLTIPDASESERLFAAQALLYRVRRYELADALDIEDHVALSLPPSSSAKPSVDAMQRANYEGMETLSGLCVAACGGGVSRPVLTHICLTLVTIAVRVATFCPQEQEDTFECVDLVMLVTSAINNAGEVYAASHQGEDTQSAVANALLHALAALPEVAAVNQMSIRPRALACAMNDLRSDRAGERLLMTLSNLDNLSSGEARLRCCLQWVTHVGLRMSSLLPLLPATASALTTICDQVKTSMMTTHQGYTPEQILQGNSILNDDGYAACELITSIFESSVERSEALEEVNQTRVTASGRRKTRKQRPNNASDIEQQLLEVELAKQGASVSNTSAELALPHFIAPLHEALSLAMICGDDKSKHALINAVASCASSQLPRLLNQCAMMSHNGVSGEDGQGQNSMELLLSLLQLLLHATNVPSSRSSENNTLTSLCLESWLRFHDATMKVSPQINNTNSSSDWWEKVEESMYQSMMALMRETRLDHWKGGIGVCDAEDREVFDDWRKESRDWIRGMITCSSSNKQEHGGATEAGMLINHNLIKRTLHFIIQEVDLYTSGKGNDWAGCESALHCMSTLGRSVTSAIGLEAQELDPLTVNLLCFLSRSVNTPHQEVELACCRHPAVVCAATLTVSSLTNWMEKRCVSTRMQGAEQALDACRSLCEASLNFSDTHPIYPIRSHDELHSGASALLKLAGSGPCCLSVAKNQEWLPRLLSCYHHIQCKRWNKVFPTQPYPSILANDSGSSNINNSASPPPSPGNDHTAPSPLSASSRRVLLACLLVLASAPGAIGSDGNEEAATRGLFPLFEVMFHSILTATSNSGLTHQDMNVEGRISEDNMISIEQDAACLSTRGEEVIRSGLAVVVDTLADLEVAVFLSSGQKPCAQVISLSTSSILSSPKGLQALKACFRLAAASSYLCDQGNNHNGDHNRLEWGGRGGHNGANIVVEDDASVSELSGILRWLLSRALARCFSERVLDSLSQAYVIIAPNNLLEFCLHMFRYDGWSDGSALFPIITAIGGGFNHDNIEGESTSFSENGLNENSTSSPSSSPLSPNYSNNSNELIESQVKKWEISNWSLTHAIETMLSSNQQDIEYQEQGQQIPLAINGRLLRKGNKYEALFTLGIASINRFNMIIKHYSGNQQELESLIESSAWLHMIPTIISLLLNDSGDLGQNVATSIHNNDHNSSSHISQLSNEVSSLVSKGKSGGVSQKPTSAKASQCLNLVFPGREAEVALKLLTSALEAQPIHVIHKCNGGVSICISLLRCACGATPSWTLDCITLCFKQLAKASFMNSDLNTRNAAMLAAMSTIDMKLKCFNNYDEETVKIWCASGQLLCVWLCEAVNDIRFPRFDVSSDAKTQFLTAIATCTAKQDWSGVKNAIKQLCGGKRKTGAGRSLGRPPDYSPWESNFDSRSITAY